MVNYHQNIKSYHQKFHDPTIVKFVDFLETLIDWVDSLYENKRLSLLQKDKIDAVMPSKTFEALDAQSSDSLDIEKHDSMKIVLLQETNQLIDLIIKKGELRVSDFDWLQFNLYQIFGKEELASMIEWARLELEKTINKRKASAQKTEHQKQQARKDHLAKINSMTQIELNHLAYTSVFDFTPSARTTKERRIALKNANQVIANQKLKFRHFELRLSDATTLARRESQSMIFRRIGQVRSDSEKSSKKFRTRAKFIVSSEGPRKSVAAAKQRITRGKQKTKQEIKETEQMFTDAEQMFTEAQDEITSKKELLQVAEEHRRVKIKEQGEVQLNLGKWIIEKAKDHMKDEEIETQQMFSKARSSLKKGKIHLELERIDTEKSFSDARKYLTRGKERMQQEQADLKLRVQKDEQRIETERQRISALDKKLALAREKLEQKMHQEKVRLSDEAKKVSSVSDQFSGAGNSAMGKISIVKKNLASQRARVLGQAKKGVKSPKVSFDRSSIKKNFVKKKEKLTEELIHKRELLAYDVRFKQHSLQSAASVQKETMTVKFENFQDEQKKLLARHRATRKSKMVRTLLRAIRTMH